MGGGPAPAARPQRDIDHVLTSWLSNYFHVFSKMEAAAKKREGGSVAALFSSDGSLNMAEFCEKISKRFVTS